MLSHNIEYFIYAYEFHTQTQACTHTHTQVHILDIYSHMCIYTLRHVYELHTCSNMLTHPSRVVQIC